MELVASEGLIDEKVSAAIAELRDVFEKEDRRFGRAGRLTESATEPEVVGFGEPEPL